MASGQWARAQIFAEDMTEDMCITAQQVASDALQESITKGKVYSHLATYIRHSFDKSFGKGWNCVVGRSFGAYVTHEIKTYVYFSPTPGVCILLWRA